MMKAHSRQVHRYIGNDAWFTILCEGLLVVLSLRKAYSIVGKIRYEGFRAHYHTLVNAYETVFLAAVFSGLAVHFVLQVMVANTRQQAVSQYEYFNGWVALVAMDETLTFLSAIIVTLATLKFTVLFRHNANVRRMLNLCCMALSTGSGVLIHLVVIFLAYAFAGHIAFGSTLQDFSTVQNAASSLFAANLGEFDYATWNEAGGSILALYFFSCQLIVVLMMLNMFVAILGDCHGITSRAPLEGNPLDMGGYIKRTVFQFVGWADPDASDAEPTQVSLKDLHESLTALDAKFARSLVVATFITSNKRNPQAEPDTKDKALPLSRKHSSTWKGLLQRKVTQQPAAPPHRRGVLGQSHLPPLSLSPKQGVIPPPSTPSGALPALKTSRLVQDSEHGTLPAPLGSAHKPPSKPAKTKAASRRATKLQSKLQKRMTAKNDAVDSILKKQVPPVTDVPSNWGKRAHLAVAAVTQEDAVAVVPSPRLRRRTDDINANTLAAATTASHANKASHTPPPAITTAPAGKPPRLSLAVCPLNSSMPTSAHAPQTLQSSGHIPPDLGVEIVKLEQQSLCSMSFVPTMAQVTQLCAQSIAVEAARAAGKRGPLLSKLHALPGKHGCCPDSLNPDDTILCQLGRGDIGPGGSIGNMQVLTVIDDRNMPLGGGSCGPNGVATACGGDRINLFYRDIPQTRGLLDAYLALRSANEDAIFDYYVKKLVSSQGNYTMDPGKDETLNPAYHKDYDHVCVLMTLVRLHGFRKCGFSVNSFCQTWLRNGSAVGNAEFSVMSPHFQNRFLVHDATQLSRVPGINDALITSYARLIHKFTQDMQKDYGVDGGGQAFVNLDGLQAQLGH